MVDLGATSLTDDGRGHKAKGPCHNHEELPVL